MNFVNQSQDMSSPIYRTPEKTRGDLSSSDSSRWLPQTPVKSGKRSSRTEKNIRVASVVASTYTVRKAPTTCKQMKGLLRSEMCLFKMNFIPRVSRLESANPVSDVLKLFKRSHSYSAQICKNLEVNLQETTA